MKSQLLATFTTKDNLDDTIVKITSAYIIIFNKVYVLQNENNVNELICTYIVDTQDGIDYNKVEGTISLHRKKHSNTLYTINALNECIKNLISDKVLNDSKMGKVFKNALQEVFDIELNQYVVKEEE